MRHNAPTWLECAGREKILSSSSNPILALAERKRLDIASEIEGGAEVRLRQGGADARDDRLGHREARLNIDDEEGLPVRGHGVGRPGRAYSERAGALATASLVRSIIERTAT